MPLGRNSWPPLLVGPVVKAANWTDFDIAFDAPSYEGQFVGGDIMVGTTIALEATNFLTITAEKIANVGAGAATSMASITTNNTGGVALTAARRNAMTLAGTAPAVTAQRFAGRESEPSSDTDPVLLNLDFNAATATVAALDVLMAALRITYGEVGSRS